MAKFYGEIGYALQEKTAPGVWTDVVTERKHFGDVLRNSRKLEEGDKINNDLTVGNSISIVADPYANEHIFAMRYVRWMGTLWTVSDVKVESPRLVLRLGGVYNGPTAPAPGTP